MFLMQIMLEIIKFTVPSLVVFATVYYMLQAHFRYQLQLKNIELRQKQSDKTLPLKLQAYERLALFCERIQLPNLIMRVRTEGMSATELRAAILISIQKEYEHNISQQIYVSENLWQIIQLAKNDTINVVNSVANSTKNATTATEFIGAIYEFLDTRGAGTLDKAGIAIRTEAAASL